MTVLRYSVLRLLVFFGVAGVLWLLGLRDSDEMPILLLLSAAISLVISAVVLKPFRDRASDEIARRVEERRLRRAGRPTASQQDADAEDAEVEGPGDYR